MTQETPVEKNFVKNYILAHGYGDFPPNSLLRPPIKKTGDVVRDYIEAAGFGLRKKEVQD